MKSLFPVGCCAVILLAAMPAHAHDGDTGSLPPVVVSGTASATKPGALRDEITRTESINAKEIEKSGATNLPELMGNRPGIDVQVECSVCNTRNITLNNLPGRFTTLMVDGVPIFSSVSNAYGLDMIGVNGLERVDISRGAGTSLIAPESLSGTVNLVTKRPGIDSFALDLGAGVYGFARQSVYATKTLATGALMFTATEQKQDSVDAIGYGISQYTGYSRSQVGIGLFLDDLGGFTLKSRFDHFEEKRMGGPLGNDYDGVIADQSGNPFDFSKGPNGSPARIDWINPSTGMLTGTPYDAGQFGLAQIVFTHRDQLVVSAERQTSAGRLRLAAGFAQHQQDSWYGGDADYFGRQKQYYLDASLQQDAWGTLLTAGISYRYEDLHSVSYSPNIGALPAPQIDADTYTYQTPGMYLQAYKALLDERLELNASLRYDDNNVYGGIVTPRLNVLWHHSDETSSRLAIGTGYRMPTSFFELEHSVLQASAVDRSHAEAEKSENLSYAWNYAGDRVTVTASANHTRIKNLALFSADPQNPTGLLLAPATSAYTVDNVDFLGTWQVSAKNALTLGVEKYTYDFDASAMQGSLFARPDYRMNLALDHTSGPWNFNVRATLTGPQDLAKFYDYADNPRYNLDGSPKMPTSPNFWVVDMHTNYQWSARVSSYLSVNNVFDYQQARVDSYLWTDAQGALDVTHIWGPNLGRSFSAGLKIAF